VLQIMGVLRVLGRGTCFGGIEELTGGSAECHRWFLHSFIEKFSKVYKDTFVHLPRDQHEREKTNMYERMGDLTAHSTQLRGITGGTGDTYDNLYV